MKTPDEIKERIELFKNLLKGFISPLKAVMAEKAIRELEWVLNE